MIRFFTGFGIGLYTATFYELKPIFFSIQSFLEQHKPKPK